jgi:hypothetical protein
MKYIVRAHKHLEEQLQRAQQLLDGIEKVDGNGTYRVPSLSNGDPHTVELKRMGGKVIGYCDCKGFRVLLWQVKDLGTGVPACVHMVAVLMRAGKLDWLKRKEEITDEVGRE